MFNNITQIYQSFLRKNIGDDYIEKKNGKQTKVKTTVKFGVCVFWVCLKMIISRQLIVEVETLSMLMIIIIRIQSTWCGLVVANKFASSIAPQGPNRANETKRQHQTEWKEREEKKEEEKEERVRPPSGQEWKRQKAIQ